MAVKVRLDLRHIVIFAMLGAIMFSSKQITEVLPNVHFLAMMTVAFTVVYRRYALIPVLLFALLEGLYAGFALWWWPYLYLWPLLWGGAMLLPQHTPKWLRGNLPGWLVRILQMGMYMLLCALHGFLYGTLYAPYHVLMFLHGNFSAMPAWIAAGLPYDLIHGISNFLVGSLVLPMAKLLVRLERGIAS